MLSNLIAYIDSHEDWLMGRILEYAQARGYTTYTSTLKEAWRLSIAGLSQSLTIALEARGDQLDLSPDEDYSDDPAAQFGIMEAQRHRERGIRLDMFLGLMKYYGQSYLDLIEGSGFHPSEKQRYCQLVKRFFDRVEIGFCTEWSSYDQYRFIEELQNSNRQMTNEKNKYLTIFESLSVPVFVLSPESKIENMNHAAAKLINAHAVSGEKYYSGRHHDIHFTQQLPWIRDTYASFLENTQPSLSCDISSDDNDQFFSVSFSRSLDVSGKFTGVVVIIEETTHQKILERELKILATTDPLTGVRNRRSFLDAFRQEASRTQRHNRSLSLLMMDVDRFKTINDTYGHDFGDNVLTTLVAELLCVLRGFDLLGRWGGDEFVVLFPETNAKQAAAIAERLRIRLAKLALRSDDGTPVDVTVSIGLVDARGPEIDIDDLVKKADQALYQAKRQGRNRVVSSV